MLNKILGVLFTVLFLVLIGEVGYLFLMQKNQKQLPVITNVSPAPLISEGIIDASQLEYLRKVKSFEIDYLNVLYSVQGEGKISNLKKNATDSVTFDITDKNNKKSTNIKFPIVKTIPFNVYKSVDNILYPASLSELEENDQVKFYWTYDLKKPVGQDLFNNQLIFYR